MSISKISIFELSFDINDISKSKRFIIVNEKKLDALYKSIDRISYSSDGKNGLYLKRLTKKISKRLAKNSFGENSIESFVFSEAWYFPLEREISMIIAVRKLAKIIFNKNKDKTILIQLTKKKFTYLNYCQWHLRDDEIETLLLVNELKRLGAKTELFAENDFFSEENPSLIFSPSSSWIKNGDSIQPSTKKDNLLLVDGVRNVNWIYSKLGDYMIPETMMAASNEEHGFRLWGKNKNPEKIIINFKKNITLHKVARVFESQEKKYNLSEKFFDSIIHLSKESLLIAKQSIESCGIKDIYICDHLFFESAIFSNLVGFYGGRVHLLPHSINHTFFDTHVNTEKVTSVTCLTKSIAEVARNKFPNAKIIINSSIMLNPQNIENCFNKEKPTTVVIFGGSHNLTRYPLMPLLEHERIWIRLLNELSKYPDKFKVIFKSKGDWESASWLSGLCENLSFEESKTPTLELDYPNMIFLSISIASAALIEGIGRGIPCMVVRERNFSDYLPLNENVIPIGGVEYIVNKLIESRNHIVFHGILSDQLNWYNSETFFGG